MLNTWSIPAKTFLLGEYAALVGGPAILVTTTPCFEVGLTADPSQAAVINQDSPAGLWWSSHAFQHHDLTWHDPYQGLGGFGASSAQFIGSFLASCSLKQNMPDLESMLKAYFQMNVQHEGMRPSAYDVIAQTQSQCVFIHRQQQRLETQDWPFTDIGFLLLHTGKKLATHEHLREQSSLSDLASLSAIAERAWHAFQTRDSHVFVASVHDYQQALTARGLMATHSLRALADLKQKYPILAAKGCGALGSDVLLLIVDMQQLNPLKYNMIKNGFNVIASHHDLYQNKRIFKII